MKKLLFLSLVVIIISGLLLSSCGPSETTTTTAPPTTTQPTTTQPTTTQPTTTQPTTTTPAAGTPQKGGTLRVLWQTGISNLSNVATQGMTDETMAKAFAETLVYYSATGDFKPELAKSWEIDTTAKTLTFHLEEGVMFHDGTPFNAEAVKWNVQNLIDSMRLANSQFVDSIEAVDEYTFRYHLNTLMTPSMMYHSYGYNLQTMFSPTAYKTAGGTISADDTSEAAIEARKSWATSHFVSTGAFKFDSWTQDVSMKIVRNDNYWRGKEYPYLDAIEFTFVADTSIASAKMQAGEADAWNGPALKEATDLEGMGFALNIGVGGFYSDLIPNNVSENSPFKDERVRQAVEYAIDREALAEGLGYGKLQAITQTGGAETSQAYDPTFPVREYNIAKAKELLTLAGLPNGFPTKMMTFTNTSNDMATAIQANLADVGIIVEIDAADPGRFIGSLYQGGWDGMLLWSCPVDPEFTLGWFVHFGPRPIFPYPSLAWSDEYVTLREKAASAPTVEQMRADTVAMMRVVSDGAFIIPLIDSLNMNVTTKKVHSMLGKEHFMTWHNYMDWMEK